MKKLKQDAIKSKLDKYNVFLKELEKYVEFFEKSTINSNGFSNQKVTVRNTYKQISSREIEPIIKKQQYNIDIIPQQQAILEGVYKIQNDQEKEDLERTNKELKQQVESLRGLDNDLRVKNEEIETLQGQIKSLTTNTTELQQLKELLAKYEAEKSTLMNEKEALNKTVEEKQKEIDRYLSYDEEMSETTIENLKKENKRLQSELQELQELQKTTPNVIPEQIKQKNREERDKVNKKIKDFTTLYGGYFDNVKTDEEYKDNIVDKIDTLEITEENETNIEELHKILNTIKVLCIVSARSFIKDKLNCYGTKSTIEAKAEGKNETHSTILKSKCTQLEKYIESIIIETNVDADPNKILNIIVETINKHIDDMDKVFSVRVMINFRTKFGDDQDGGKSTQSASENYTKLVPASTKTEFVTLKWNFPTEYDYGPFYKVLKNSEGINVDSDMDNFFRAAFDPNSVKMHYIYSAYGYSGSGKTYSLTESSNNNSVLQRVLTQIKEKCGEKQDITVKVCMYDLYGEKNESDSFVTEKITNYIAKKNSEDGLYTVTHQEIIVPSTDTQVSPDLKKSISLPGKYQDFERNIKNLRTIVLPNDIMNVLKMYESVDNHRRNVQNFIITEDDKVKLEPRIRVTPNNDASSRSHMFIDMFIMQTTATIGRITIMDMAGTENVENMIRDYYYTDNSLRYFEIDKENMHVKSLNEIDILNDSDTKSFDMLINRTNDIIKFMMLRVKPLTVKLDIQLINIEEWIHLYNVYNTDDLKTFIVLYNAYHISDALCKCRNNLKTYKSMIRMYTITKDTDGYKLEYDLSNICTFRNNNISDGIIQIGKTTPYICYYKDLYKNIRTNFGSSLSNNILQIKFEKLMNDIFNNEDMINSIKDNLNEIEKNIKTLTFKLNNIKDDINKNFESLEFRMMYNHSASTLKNIEETIAYFQTHLVTPEEKEDIYIYIDYIPTKLKTYLDEVKHKYHDPIEYQGRYINHTLIHSLKAYTKHLSDDPSLQKDHKDLDKFFLTGAILKSNIYDNTILSKKFILLANARLDFNFSDEEIKRLYENIIPTEEIQEISPEDTDTGNKKTPKFRRVIQACEKNPESATKEMNYLEALSETLRFAHCVNPFKTEKTDGSDVCGLEFDFKCRTAPTQIRTASTPASNSTNSLSRQNSRSRPPANKRLRT